MNIQKFFLSIFCIISLPCYGINTNINKFYFDEIQSLSELPLEKLIKIKSSFSKKSANEKNVAANGRTLSAFSLSMTMPQKRIGNKSIRRYDDWDEKSKDSKISKIFQLTVTALSFLAFGGYLLTLIITAIRRGQTVNTPTSLIVLSDLQNFQKIKRPKREFVLYNVHENEYDPERLYSCMIMMSNEYRNHYYS